LPRRQEQEPDLDQEKQTRLDQLEDVIAALDMKMRGLTYQRQEYELRARQYCKETQMARAKGQLRLAHDKQVTHDRYCALHTNVCMVRNRLEEAHTYAELGTVMEAASVTLAQVLQDTSPEKIDLVMDQLGENGIAVQQVGDALAQDTDLGSVFDEDAALQQLLGTEPVLELPDVPTRPIPKTDSIKKETIKSD
jgi:hypothetical protein